jgi:hypothetical protein
MQLALVLVSGGFALGFLVGRWWALVPAAALGAWTATSVELEAVPGWYIGLVYAGLSALGIVAGALLRRRLRRRS